MVFLLVLQFLLVFLHQNHIYQIQFLQLSFELFLNSYKINYLGHGCLLLGNSINDLKKTRFISRAFPEELQNVDEILDKGIDIINGNEHSKQLIKK